MVAPVALFVIISYLEYLGLNMPLMIRLVLADDQPVVRQGLRRRLSLEPDMSVVGEASNGREAIALVQQLIPEIVLMDVEMPELDGISATAVLHDSIPQSTVIMLSIHDNVSTRARAYAAGAAALVNKGGEIETLLETIRAASSHH